MIDIHSHILFGVDDGAANENDTRKMLHMATDSGVSCIVATPHCNMPSRYENYYGSWYVRLFRRVQEIAIEEELPITILSGMEVFATDQIGSLIRNKKVLTINQSKYLLLEFSMAGTAEIIEDRLREVFHQGMVPVVAHPERYKVIQERPWLVGQWMAKGVAVQINKGSLQGSFGKAAEITGHRLLKHRMVSVVASDAHSYKERTPQMKSLYNELVTMYDEGFMKSLFYENPRKICSDEALDEPRMISFF